MLMNCKECGAEISNLAKRCPRCGCPNITKSKLAIASLTIGIISIVYGLGSCANDFFTEDKKSTILPIIIVMGVLSVIFGFLAIRKTKEKKALWGIILGVTAVIISIIGHLFL